MVQLSIPRWVSRPAMKRQHRYLLQLLLRDNPPSATARMLTQPYCEKYCCQSRMLWSRAIESLAEAVPTRCLGANPNRAAVPAKYARGVPGRLRPGQREAHASSLETRQNAST